MVTYGNTDWWLVRHTFPIFLKMILPSVFRYFLASYLAEKIRWHWLGIFIYLFLFFFALCSAGPIWGLFGHEAKFMWFLGPEESLVSRREREDTYGIAANNASYFYLLFFVLIICKVVYLEIRDWRLKRIKKQNQKNNPVPV